jgi:hypothetical protein
MLSDGIKWAEQLLDINNKPALDFKLMGYLLLAYAKFVLPKRCAPDCFE